MVVRTEFCGIGNGKNAMLDTFDSDDVENVYGAAVVSYILFHNSFGLVIDEKTFLTLSLNWM